MQPEGVPASRLDPGGVGKESLRQDARQEAVQKAGLSMPLGTPGCSSAVKL